MNLKRVSILMAVCTAVSAQAIEPIPDRIYFTFATKHYGMGEEVFGVDGPNEINPGVGFAWEDLGPGFILSSGFYKDSFSQIAYTGGLSYPLFEREHVKFTLGMSVTASFGGNTTIKVEDKNNPGSYVQEIVEPRLYAWPFLNLTLGNAFVQWRPGLNRDLEPAGVIAAGITFKLKPDRRR